MDSILDFYLTSVLPTAMAGVTEDTRDLQPHMESIQRIFDGLKRDVFTCVSVRHTCHCNRRLRERKCPRNAAHLTYI